MMTDSQVYFEDIGVDDVLPDMEKIPSRAQLFMYSAISWNIHRIHYDVEYSRTEGHPTVLVHGPLQGALAVRIRYASKPRPSSRTSSRPAALSRTAS